MNSATKMMVAASLLLASFTACKKETQTVTVNNPIYNLRGSASGKQEVPANSSTATGNVTGTYNKESNALQYTITWSGLTGGPASAMHFHGAADPGVSVGVAVPITGFTAAASGTYTGSSTLNDAQETDLTKGQWYFNIHDSTYAGGEIRGQVILYQ